MRVHNQVNSCLILKYWMLRHLKFLVSVYRQGKFYTYCSPLLPFLLHFHPSFPLSFTFSLVPSLFLFLFFVHLSYLPLLYSPFLSTPSYTLVFLPHLSLFAPPPSLSPFSLSFWRFPLTYYLWHKKVLTIRPWNHLIWNYKILAATKCDEEISESRNKTGEENKKTRGGGYNRECRL